MEMKGKEEEEARSWKEACAAACSTNDASCYIHVP
jgi:hypothetical protein